jgi:hypothetical protein
MKLNGENSIKNKSSGLKYLSIEVWWGKMALGKFLGKMNGSYIVKGRNTIIPTAQATTKMEHLSSLMDLGKFLIRPYKRGWGP